MIKELKNIKSTKKELREFGLLVGGVLLALGLFALFRGKDWGQWATGIGGALIALGLMLPIVLKPFQKIWMALALLLGAVMSRLILLLLFYLVLTPIAIFARLIGKSFLDLKIDKNTTSYWIKRSAEGQSPVDSKRQF
jgi:cell division protein FtsW (lipid II flippase)